MTASGQTNNQWLKIALPASHAWLLDHVALQPRSEPGFETSSPRRFEIQLSTTTSDDTSFATVLKGTLRNNGTLQHFFFDAVDAKYVRVLLEDNYGGGVSGLQTFAVYSPQIGSLNARFRDRSTDVDGAIERLRMDVRRRRLVERARPGPRLRDGRSLRRHAGGDRRHAR